MVGQPVARVGCSRLRRNDKPAPKTKDGRRRDRFDRPADAHGFLFAYPNMLHPPADAHRQRRRPTYS